MLGLKNGTKVRIIKADPPFQWSLKNNEYVGCKGVITEKSEYYGDKGYKISWSGKPTPPHHGTPMHVAEQWVVPDVKQTYGDI